MRGHGREDSGEAVEDIGRLHPSGRNRNRRAVARVPMGSQPKFRAIRGVKDILPGETARWQAVERNFREVFALYGYEEIRFPIFEETALFARGLGDTTDIVEKEMYTFPDSGGTSVTLRSRRPPM